MSERRHVLMTPPMVGTGPLLRVATRFPVFAAVAWLTLAGAAILVTYPLIRLLVNLFFADGQLTFASIGVTLSDPSLPPALASTAVLIATAGPLALVIGAVLAWLNERTDARIGWAADTLPIIPLLVPSIATAIGWVFLLAPRAGFFNALFRGLFQPGSQDAGPLNIYTAAGMIWVTAVVTVPLAYLTIAAALRNVDPAIEEASSMFGASPLRTLLEVTLPSVRNALATAAVLVLIGILSLFSVPVIIGSQGGIDVLAVLIFRSLNAPGGPRFDEMIVLSTFMLIAVQTAVVAEHLLTRSGHHARLGGRGHSRARTELGQWRLPARAAIGVYLVSATVLPMAGLALVSLQGFWSPTVLWDKLSLANYQQIFAANSALGRAFTNSLVLGVATATVLMLAGAVIAYYVTGSSSSPVARLVNGLTALPASVPHVVTGVAFLLSIGSGRVSLQGTLALLLLAYLVMALPHASRSASVALSQVGRELWEASLMSGASQLRTFIRILLPAMLPGLLAGWVIVFVNSFSETSASVFLSTPTANPVTGPVIVDVFRNSGTYPQIAALALSVTLVQTVTVLLVQAAGQWRIDYRND
jgi:iron(III) transport system permease protein